MDNIKIVSVEADEETIEKVKNIKYRYTQNMINNGLRYIAVQLMSGILNNAIELFNTGKTEDIKVHESYTSTSYDNVEISKHIDLLKKHMIIDGIPLHVVYYIEKVSREALVILEKREKKLREEYERKIKEE